MERWTFVILLAIPLLINGIWPITVKRLFMDLALGVMTFVVALLAAKYL